MGKGKKQQGGEKREININGKGVCVGESRIEKRGGKKKCGN